MAINDLTLTRPHCEQKDPSSAQHDEGNKKSGICYNAESKESDGKNPVV
jgi:hypothetical protein